MDLIFPEYLNSKEMEKVLFSLQGSDGNFNVVDLSKINFIFPYGLNMLLHIMEEIEAFNTIKFPNEKIMSYLIRMGFFEKLKESWDLTEEILYDISLHERGINSDNKTLLELTRISHFSHVFPVLHTIEEKVSSILKEQLHYTSQEIKKFKDILDELCQNISRHSKSHGYVSVQYVPYYFTQNRIKYNWPVKIGITDCGIGFAETYDNVFSDKEAIYQAVIENKSSKSKGGMGFKYIKSYVSEFGGELFIRSGGASYYQDGKKGNYEINSDISFFKGCQIDITLPTKLSS
ncbi:ATP-binding protein [Bacillus sp. S/N-304-OC-R1]|uniref:ATP-binding protein n=1 Tax=Bacillus sp. S/N-304-OC-R1 TaxID=2758034 RepID=UPI001C8E6C01|nr:ATP-binding protein [Bacillus sp. S/N-304-OC-R1]MBY0122133.1 ATP-binding protein [Bacillus sp. S/N-304-OC-R1]